MSVYSAIHGAEVTLVDIESNALETATLFARNEGVHERLVCLHSDVFPEILRSKKFDLIIAKDIIEHITNDKEFLRDLATCQETGGRLLLSTQNALSLNAILGSLYYRSIKGYKTWYGWDSTHLRFYTVNQIKRMLTSNSYSVTRISSIYILPYGTRNYKKAWAKPVIHLSILFDRFLGETYPFNRWGWLFIVDAQKL